MEMENEVLVNLLAKNTIFEIVKKLKRIEQDVTVKCLFSGIENLTESEKFIFSRVERKLKKINLA
jgi:hypothetical protein